MLNRRIFLLAFALMACTGCLAKQLNDDSVQEAMTVGDLEQEQVLNNLAMFVYDCNSMPYFSYPNQGSAVVSDQEGGSLTPGFGRLAGNGTVLSVAKAPTGTTTTTSTLAPKHIGDFLLTSLGLSGTGQMTNQQSFTLTPITDPRKLELMRCAYQQAVSSCCPNCGPSKNCPDCQARFNAFYTGDPEGKIGQSTNGVVTSDCLRSECCWFHIGHKKDLPKHCECIPIGHYCGVYVWVACEGRDELTKLTLAILDYATNSAPVPLTKDVQYNIDEYGLPTLSNDSMGTVKATIAIGERPESLLNIPEADAVRIEQQLQSRLKELQGLYQEDVEKKDNAAAQQALTEMGSINRKLHFLDELLRAGPLKQQFTRGASGAASPFSVIPQLQQAINAQTPPAPLVAP